MTVTNITQNELFTVRVYKRYGANVWANNYEIRARQDIPFAQTAILDLVNALTNLEQPIYPSYIRIDRVVVSTYQPDSIPYNPDNFTTIPVNAFGQVNFQTDPMPLEYCLFVRRVTQAGRPGKLLYRGVFEEGTVTTADLRPIVTTARLNQLQNHFSSWFAGFLSNNNPFELVMASGQENIQVRLVQGLVVSQSIVLKQVGNAYFDRRP
jgi:hypothetical protein